jgi:hypothetical protein
MLVIDEVPLPILSITLYDGRIWFNAQRWIAGECNVAENGDMSIHAPDGTLIMSVPSNGGDVATSRNGYMTVSLPLAITDKTGVRV